MTKEVFIAIRGLQAAPEDNSDKVEVIVPGEYYYRNNKHYILFEEVLEGTDVVTKSVIKLAPDHMELTRKGPVSTHMVFEKDKQNVTYYYTPYGSILMGIDARKVQLIETEDCIEADILYSLDMNYEKVADSNIHIVIRPRAGAKVKLVE